MSEEKSRVLPPAPPEKDPQIPDTPLVETEQPASGVLPPGLPEAAKPIKSPLAAALLAFFPFGLGHFYLGQYARALCFFIAFWVSILVLQTPLLGVFFYFFGIFDAFRQAQLINLAADEGRETPATSYEGGLAAGVFLLALGAYLLLRQWMDLSFIREFIQQWWPGILVIIGLWMIVGALREQKRPKAETDLFSD